MTGPAPLVTILLATRNGASFLREQLMSIKGLSHTNWRLIASDDGSSDASLAMLETFQAECDHGRVVIRTGPGRGATANFLDLLAQADLGDGFVAFCDQDDIWLPVKLSRAVSMIGEGAPPTLYGCAVTLCDAEGRTQGVSAAPIHPLTFGHALAENVLTGNAMVMNAAAAKLVRDAVLAGPDRAVLEAGFHDWFAYQVVIGAGGRVVFDPEPGLLYRQHGANVVGSGQAKGRLWHRIRRVLSGDYGAATRLQALALQQCPVVTADCRKAVSDLLSLRALWIWQRPAVMRRLGLYRQSQSENLLLKLLMLMGRI